MMGLWKKEVFIYFLHIFNISRFIFDKKYDKITDIFKEKNISSELAMVIGCITITEINQ